MEVYTEIYAQVKGAEKLTAFTDQYDQRIDSVMKRSRSHQRGAGEGTV